MAHNIGPNKKLLRAIESRRKAAERARGINSFLTNALGAFQQQRQMQASDQMAQQAGFAPGAGRYINPSVLAQAVLAKQAREADMTREDARHSELLKQRAEDMKRDDEYRADMLKQRTAEEQARHTEWVQAEGNRQDEFDRTQDRYAEQERRLATTAAESQAGQNWRAGLREVGDTMRAVGGGIKDLAIAAARQQRTNAPRPPSTLAVDQMHAQREQELIDQLDAMDTAQWGPTVTPEMAQKNPALVPHIGQRLTSVMTPASEPWFGRNTPAKSMYPERIAPNTPERAKFEADRKAIMDQLEQVRRKREVLRGMAMGSVTGGSDEAEGQYGEEPVPQEQSADDIYEELFGGK